MAAISLDLTGAASATGPRQDVAPPPAKAIGGPSAPRRRPTWATMLRRLARSAAFFGSWAPKGLYARALIIIIAPIVILQSILTFVFLDRHWQAVTRRLSTA